METLYNKEKRLETVLEKLKNLNSLQSVPAGDLDNNLVLKYNELKNHIKKIENEQKKTKEIQEQFNQDIEELGEETDSLVDEIEKWQI